MVVIRFRCTGQVCDKYPVSGFAEARTGQIRGKAIDGMCHLTPILVKLLKFKISKKILVNKKIEIDQRQLQFQTF